MAQRQTIAFTTIALAIVFLTLWQACAVRAQLSPDPNFSLESDIFQSDLVVEGRLVSPRTKVGKLDAVRVTAVYFGSAEVGRTIWLDGIGNLEKPSAIAGSNSGLEPKDDLILFLQRTADNNPAWFSRDDFEMISPHWPGSDIGAWKVARGKTFGFLGVTPNITHWGDNETIPPYVADNRPRTMSGWPSSHESALTVRQHIRECAGRVSEWRARLDRPPVRGDIPWLLAILKDRHTQRMPAKSQGNNGLIWNGPWSFDPVGDAAGGQLARLGDFLVMMQAVEEDPDKAGRFSHAFATREGRNFLMDRAGDRTLTAAARKLAVDELVSTKDLHLSATTQPAWWEEKIAPRNDSYFTRLARLASDIRTPVDNQIAVALLRMMYDQVAPSRLGRRNAQLSLDLQDASRELLRVYGRSDISEEMRFCIESAMYAIGDSEYSELHSRCGPVLTLAQPPGEWEFRSGDIVCEFRSVREGEPVDGATLVVESIADGSSFALPSVGFRLTESPILRGGYEAETLALPSNFKPGKYRIHYRLTHGSEVVSEGHACELTLPRPAPPTVSWGFTTLPPIPTTPKPWPRSWKAGMLATLIAVPTLLLLRALFRTFRQRRRLRRGLCPQCAYDLRFSHDRCPECGRATSGKAMHSFVRRSMARMAIVVSILVMIATTIAWVRSYRVADCWIRTTAERADSVYLSRGVVVVKLLTDVDQPGWFHQTGEPPAYARSMAESGDLPRWGLGGIEYSSLSQMLVVPMRAVFVLFGLSGLFVVWSLRRLT